MSGIVGSVKKVFRKVVKVVKKIAPIALAAAAIYFTAGAALGVAGTAGGWGGAVSGLVGKLGLSSTLSGVLTGAVTQAGYGAVLGGGLSLATGGDVSQGLLRGATTGAVTGGVLGGFGVGTDPLKGIGEAATTPATATTAVSSPTGITPITGVPDAAGLAAGTPPPATGLLSRAGGFIEKNPVASGLAIQGLGAGISGFAEADARTEAAETLARRERDEAARIAGNFRVGGGLLTGGAPAGGVPDTTARPTPAQQFSPTTALAKSRGAIWRYDPVSGQIELTEG